MELEIDGLSKITYKDKEIIYVDYSSFRLDKEKTFKLIYGSADEYLKHPLESVLALVNLTNLYFDNEIINAFKTAQEETIANEKKVALIGLKGLQILAYNYVINMKNRDKVRVFENISEAREWLVND